MKLFFVLIIAVAVFCQSIKATIIGIDLASDALKVAIIQPGKPLEIGKSSFSLMGLFCV
jgi:hypothetical protein